MTTNIAKLTKNVKPKTQSYNSFLHFFYIMEILALTPKGESYVGNTAKTAFAVSCR